MNVLETRNLTKIFPGVTALDSFSFDVRPGEIHGLVGENGAGKSTLVKIIAGVSRATSGTVYIDGHEADFRSPRDALGKVGVVHQERELIGHFNGCENLFLGEEETTGPFLKREAMHKKAAEILEHWGISVPMDCPVSDLGSGQQEMIMLMRVLLSSPKIVVFDEPTASLSAGECEVLFRLIADLKKRGTAVLYISHNLPEVISLCDRITVMRNGKKIDTVERGTEESKLIRLMVNHEVTDQYPKTEASIGETIFEVKDFSSDSAGIKKTDFYIRRGEIVGFAGLVGSGRTELAQAIFSGQKHEGSLLMRGKAFKSSSTAASIKSGLAMIPEDRRGEGIIPGMSVAGNIRLPGLKNSLTSLGFINFTRTRETVSRIISRYGIKVADAAQTIETLSGGNQQKVSVGKWDGFAADLWIFDDPTQGIDVEAKREIYGIMGRIAQSGAGIWFISSELRELTALADRIYVMNGRRITAEFTPPYDQEKILTAMMSRNNKEAV